MESDTQVSNGMVVVRPIVQASPLAVPAARKGQINALLIAGSGRQMVQKSRFTAKVCHFIWLEIFGFLSKSNVKFVPLVFGVGAMATFVAALFFQKNPPLAMFATTGVFHPPFFGWRTFVGPRVQMLQGGNCERRC